MAVSGLRFGILGAHPERVSRLGRMTIERLRAEGATLVTWVEGDDEAVFPWDLHEPSPLPDAASISRSVPSDLDFFLQLDLSEPAPELLNLPRFGVWRFTSPSPGPLAFWDVFDGLYYAELRLEKLTTEPLRRISLDRRWVRVDRLSYRRTLADVVEELSRMPAYVARGNLAAPWTAIALPGTPAHAPSFFDLIRLRVRLLLRGAKEQARGIFFSESWQIGIVEGSITNFAEMNELPKVRWLASPGVQRFRADPFIAYMPGRDAHESPRAGWLLMAEDYNYSTDRGKIVQEFSTDGNFTGRMQDAITEPIHMSHPQLLEHEGELLCIPETHQRNGVWAWRWDERSGTWGDPRVILPDIACIDPTPLYYNGRWWLFFTNKVDGVDAKLQIYFADSLWGPWHPHTRNPVKTDIRSSRPGGTPFVYRGELYRPAQDSSKHYGWRLMVNRVTRLSPEDFEEEVVRVVDSDRLGASGIHTLSGAGDKTVVDARHWRFTPWLAPRKLAHKLRILFR